MLPAHDSATASGLYNAATVVAVIQIIVLLVHVLLLPKAERVRPTLWAVPLLSVVANTAQLLYLQNKPLAVLRNVFIIFINLISVLVCLSSY